MDWKFGLGTKPNPSGARPGEEVSPTRQYGTRKGVKARFTYVTNGQIRANAAHVRQSSPDAGLSQGLVSQVHVLKIL